MEIIFAALPVLFLIVVMTLPRPLPTPVAFAIASLVALAISAFYFQRPAGLLGAAVVAGLLEALTPIAIVSGAILFFVCMENSGATDVIRQWLHGISPNPIAQVMIVGWAFMFLVEGASGFGTPAALAAPLLVGLGFPALPVAAVCLVFNTTPTIVGAVGTPLWFGFGPLDLGSEALTAIAARGAFLQAGVAFVIPVVALRFLFPWHEIARNLIFILLVIACTVVPFALVALGNYEFPSVIGGLCGLGCGILLARFRVGLAGSAADAAAALQSARQPAAVPPAKVLLALAPLLATIAILLVTRIPALGVRSLLTSTDGGFSIPMGAMGVIFVSSSLVFQWRDILGQQLSWSFPLLYIPAIIPFLLTGLLAVGLFRGDAAMVRRSLRETFARVSTPVLALFGALVFVKLLLIGEERAATHLLGTALAALAGETWVYFAPFLGALGSFFSGSATISNLTFGGIQTGIAGASGECATNLLALQAAGAAMGNMVCIHNIVAVCAVLGLKNSEGAILRNVFPLLLLYGALLAMLQSL